jgi:hypothetical protein
MTRPKQLVLLVSAGLFVLVGAAAATLPHPQTADVSATFTAAQVRMNTHTCAQGGDTFRVTNAVWRGTSTSSEPRLAGTAVITTHAVVNETTGDGWASGTWHTTNSMGANPARAKSNARLAAVIDNGNQLDGLASGEGRRPYARLLGNFSATIDGGTLSGELGANGPVSPENSALLYRGGCP